MAMNDSMPSVLLENVVNLIHAKIPAEQVKQVEFFAKSIYGNMSKDDLRERNDSDLYGAVIGLWNSLNETSSQEVFIRVYNPCQTNHGWQSSYSIIEIIHPDMPFLVDSIGMTLSRMGITTHMMLHTPLAIKRKKQDIISVKTICSATKTDERVAIFTIEIDRQSDSDFVQTLEQEICSVLSDVDAAVKDWQPMSKTLDEITNTLPKLPFPGESQEVDESIKFLKYLNDHHFTLLGYRYYDLKWIAGDVELVPDLSSGLGLLNKSKTRYLSQGVKLSELPENARKQALNNSLLVLTKGRDKSRVHRPAYVDYIGIKRFDKKGKVIGEDRFLGLYASTVYNRSPDDIPLLARKVEQVLVKSGFSKGSHDYKALENILDNLPRDELIQANIEQLYQLALGVLQTQDRDKLKLFVRKDSYGRFFSCMVYIARDRYNTKLREASQRIFAKHFNSSEDVEFTTYFSESILARTHYIVHVNDNNMEVDIAAIETDLIEAARSWEDKFYSALCSALGEDKGGQLDKKYHNAFPQSYMQDVLPSSAVVDMGNLEALVDKQQLGMLFYQPQETALKDQQVRLKLFHKDEPIFLSDMLPMLENFGLRVINERPYEINTSTEETYWILDFLMTINSTGICDINQCQNVFQTALDGVWNGVLEDDGFNRLVLTSALTGREVAILRAYAKYMRQIGDTFSQAYIEDTFTRYPKIAELLVKMFSRKFNPQLKIRSLDKIENSISQLLDEVASLDDDRIICRYLDLIKATVRTNFYQTEATENKAYISFKFFPELIPEMPMPLPKFEIFVYSPRLEGVHLRGGKVARGGLRWSDRREDFRTEVLGLVKAQQVKNTVIVPVGAKGGFVCKKLSNTTSRADFFNEGQACYKLFIRGLLDITDNVVNGQIVKPTDVVCHDDDDSYLVVAADKGTATFSDIANSIALEYKFWLGDAFASGGSNGYDHKKMGITAKGAWESVKRHFREMDLDCQKSKFTCIGIGDMAGDVFGNGMLLSPFTCLVAAFNHLHIFIDPNPDVKASYAERQRLFRLSGSSWTDYNEKLISKGGGIFERSAKSIKLTAEMKKLIGTNKAALTPTELVHLLFKTEVDLIWNGGIGTYVKSSDETHADVGDRTNDTLRVNGNEVKAKIIGEGGNLGCTQLGRIEYAANGGRINTDFVDNVGGVDCSDYEVNIKILLNALVADSELTLKQRNLLLEAMTEEVSENVLRDCQDQTRSMSVTQIKGHNLLKEQIRFIHYLEKIGKLNRDLEFLPNEEELAERLASGKALTRPELSVLVAYGKMLLKEQLLIPEITEDPSLSKLLIDYFPARLGKSYAERMLDHPLRGEIIATALANQLINDMGMNFMQRMQDETGASIAEVALCYSMARDVFDLAELTLSISKLTGTVAAEVKCEMLYQLRRNIRRACRWFLRNRHKNYSIQQAIEFYKPVFVKLRSDIKRYLVDEEVKLLESETDKLVTNKVPVAIAGVVAGISTLFSSLDIAQIAQQEKKSIALVAEIYFKLGAKLDLHWFLQQINLQPVTNHWQALARAAFREELDWQQCSLTSVVLNSQTKQAKAEIIIDQWIENNQILLERWFHTLADFRTSSSHEFAKFSVALRELNLLIRHCEGQC